MNSYTQRDLSNSSLEKAQLAEQQALKTVSYNRAIASNDIATADHIMNIEPASQIDRMKELGISKELTEKVEQQVLTDQIMAQARLKDSNISRVMVENKLLNLNTEQKQKIKQLLPTLDRDELQQIMMDGFESALNPKSNESKKVSNDDAYKLVDRLAVRQKDSKSEITIWEQDFPQIEFIEDKTNSVLTLIDNTNNAKKQYLLTPSLYAILRLQPKTLKDNNVLVNFTDREAIQAVLDYDDIIKQLNTIDPAYFKHANRSEKLNSVKSFVRNIQGSHSTPANVPQITVNLDPYKSIDNEATLQTKANNTEIDKWKSDLSNSLVFRVDTNNQSLTVEDAGDPSNQIEYKLTPSLYALLKLKRVGLEKDYPKEEMKKAINDYKDIVNTISIYKPSYFKQSGKNQKFKYYNLQNAVVPTSSSVKSNTPSRVNNTCNTSNTNTYVIQYSINTSNIIISW